MKISALNPLAVLPSTAIVPILHGNFNYKVTLAQIAALGGAKGDPGGDASQVGLFSQISTLSPTAGTKVIYTTGNILDKAGPARYVEDVALNDAYVAANPFTAAKTANARYFRLDISNGVFASHLGCDMSGLTTTVIARVTAWLELAATAGVKAICNGVLQISTTPGAAGPADISNSLCINLTNRTLVIVGDGAGICGIRREAGSVTANAQCLLRFYASAGGKFYMTDCFLDFDALIGNITPGGALSTNFTWQHNGLCEFRTGTNVDGFDQISCRNIELRNPIADGFSFRGGPATGAGWKDVFLQNVRNPNYSIFAARPRVRGDITVTGVIRNIMIVNCVLPRLHFERDVMLNAPLSNVSVISVINTHIGESLAHNPGNSATATLPGVYEAIQYTMIGGSINWDFFAGCNVTKMLGVAFTLGIPSGHNRLTEGDFHFDAGCTYQVAATCQCVSPAGEGFFLTSSPYARRIEVVGGKYLASFAGSIPPKWVIYAGDNGGGLGDGLYVNGLHIVDTKTQICFIREDKNSFIENTISNYDGVGGALSGAAIQKGTSAVNGTSKLIVKNNHLTNSATKLLNMPFLAISGTGGACTLNFSGNICGLGKAFDFSSASYGVGARTQFGTAWLLEQMVHENRIAGASLAAARPVVGDFMAGERLIWTGAGAATDHGLTVTAPGRASVAEAVFVKLPILGAVV